MGIIPALFPPVLSICLNWYYFFLQCWMVLLQSPWSLEIYLWIRYLLISLISLVSMRLIRSSFKCYHRFTRLKWQQQQQFWWIVFFKEFISSTVSSYLYKVIQSILSLICPFLFGMWFFLISLSRGLSAFQFCWFFPIVHFFLSFALFPLFLSTFFV